DATLRRVAADEGSVRIAVRGARDRAVDAVAQDAHFAEDVAADREGERRADARADLARAASTHVLRGSDRGRGVHARELLLRPADDAAKEGELAPLCLEGRGGEDCDGEQRATKGRGHSPLS